MSKVAGMTTLDVHLHSSCFSKEDGTELGINAAEPFFQYLSRFIKGVGGAIPLIVKNQTGANCHDELDQAATNTLNDESLSELTSVLDNVPIYFFGREAGKFVGSGVEGRVTWTLPPEEFTQKEKPDVTKARLLIFVENLEEVIENYSTLSSSPKVLIGRARVSTHELVHAIRMKHAIEKHFGTLTWERNAFGDWCVTCKDVVEKIGTPPKLAKISIGAKMNSMFPADAGRAWEHSVTGGHIFQTDFHIVMAFKRPEDDASKIQCFDVLFSRADSRAIIEDPSNLIRISRRMAQTAEPDLCPAGHQVVTGMACSRMVKFVQYKCGSSVGWKIDAETQWDLLSSPTPTR